LQDGQLTVWTHSQGVYPLRGAIAEMLRIAKDRVRCIHMEGSGCYGHNGADDAAAEAALIASAFPGRPVRLQWMREEENAWEPYGSAMVSAAKARLDAGGNVVDWLYEVWSSTHSSRPGAAGNPRRRGNWKRRSRRHRRRRSRSRPGAAIGTPFRSTNLRTPA
jgi:CO/xanthine dehydrogenase Mo-binding subunit